MNRVDHADRVHDGKTIEQECIEWLDHNWDPDLTVGQWWERLGTSGWAAPAWPTEWFGRVLPRSDAIRVGRAIASYGALGPPAGFGLNLAGPTILAHGTTEQKSRYLRDIVTGARSWCQLFSEPGAGSDLSGVSTEAVSDGDELVISGEKVWTTAGQYADFGMLLARTNADEPRHAGISWIALDMHQPGVDVHPLREMTGRAVFNHVYLTDARAWVGDVIGGLGNGWAAAKTTLAVERTSLSSESSGVDTRARPGTVAGDLERRAGDLIRTKDQKPYAHHKSRAADGVAPTGRVQALLDLARQSGAPLASGVRQDLARLHTLESLGRILGLRLKAGARIPGAPNLGKLAESLIVVLCSDLSGRIVGPYGTLHYYDNTSRRSLETAVENPALVSTGESVLFSPAPSIYGGTDQIQRNIIGERILGLAKETGS